ncbi:uncharacterized protein LOC119173568 [Rhipicephalus microplus]|uniref:uncharacterized protein LOC119173568 n=1 Tax=Rhipicephalus microplus TaxID=6941 RepID=UPI003F6C3EDC
MPASDPDSSAPAVRKYDSLVKQLNRLFAASTNPLVEGHKFTSCRQLPGESFLDFVTVLKEKAVQCKFGLTYAERVRDQIIRGSSKVRVREKVLAYGEELSLEKAEEVGRTLEALFLANQEFAPSQPEHVEAVGQGAQYGGARRKNGRASRGGSDVTHQVREAKMATFSGSRRRGTVLQSQMGSLEATSNLNCTTTVEADSTTQVFEIVQPEVDVAIRATLGDISRRCAARLPLYSASLRGELSTSYRSSRPPLS